MNRGLSAPLLLTGAVRPPARHGSLSSRIGAGVVGIFLAPIRQDHVLDVGAAGQAVGMLFQSALLCDIVGCLHRRHEKV